MTALAALLIGAGIALTLAGMRRREGAGGLPDDLGYRPAGTPAESPRAASLLVLAGSLPRRLFAGPRARRRVRRFDAELPEALDLLAGSLEAGSSLAQAMELVAEEGRAPLSEEFGRVLADTRLGEPLTQALEAAAARVGSRELGWFVRAVSVQQEYGTSLADLMRTLAEFMRWREELRREVRALTAEGRISAYVLVALPFLISAFFMLVNPSYLGTLVTSGIGLTMLFSAGVFMAIGILWMKRVIKVEV